MTRCIPTTLSTACLFADDPPKSNVGGCETALLLFTEKITHAHNGIDLFLSESRQKISPN